MSLTPAEVLSILVGNASSELQARFLHETDDPQSGVNQMLRGVAEWARVNLNTNCPSPPAGDAIPQDGNAVPTYRIVRKAALLDEDEQCATAADLVDYLREVASPEVTERVKKALQDPSSELSDMLRRLKNRGN